MSAKYFCDKCKSEMRYVEHGRVKLKLDKFQVEIMVAIDGTWNYGHLCHACVLNVVANGRPVEAAMKIAVS